MSSEETICSEYLLMDSPGARSEIQLRPRNRSDETNNKIQNALIRQFNNPTKVLLIKFFCLFVANHVRKNLQNLMKLGKILPFNNANILTSFLHF